MSDNRKGEREQGPRNAVEVRIIRVGPIKERVVEVRGVPQTAIRAEQWVGKKH